MSAASETIGLYRSFLRLRHSFPNKQARSVLKRWTGLYFRLRQSEYRRISGTEGFAVAEEEARKWRIGARDDLGKYEKGLQLVCQEANVSMQCFVLH